MIPPQVPESLMDTSAAHSKGRLIVIVPGCLIDPVRLAHWVSDLAAMRSKNLLFLTLANEADDVLTLNRQQVTFSLVARQVFVEVETLTIPAERWLDQLASLYTPQDEWVCLAEHQVRTGLLHKIALGSILGRQFSLPVTSLSGFLPLPSNQPRTTRSEAAAWIGSLLIIGLFLAVDINVTQLVSGIAGQLLLVIALPLEISLLVAWNGWIG